MSILVRLHYFGRYMWHNILLCYMKTVCPSWHFQPCDRIFPSEFMLWFSCLPVYLFLFFFYFLFFFSFLEWLWGSSSPQPQFIYTEACSKTKQIVLIKKNSFPYPSIHPSVFQLLLFCRVMWGLELLQSTAGPCMHTHAHTHIHVHAHIHTHMCTYTHACVHTGRHACTQAHTHTQMHAQWMQMDGDKGIEWLWALAGGGVAYVLLDLEPKFTQYI